jgi:hypothetical protein
LAAILFVRTQLPTRSRRHILLLDSVRQLCVPYIVPRTGAFSYPRSHAGDVCRSSCNLACLLALTEHAPVMSDDSTATPSALAMTGVDAAHFRTAHGQPDQHARRLRVIIRDGLHGTANVPSLFDEAEAPCTAPAGANLETLDSMIKALDSDAFFDRRVGDGLEPNAYFTSMGIAADGMPDW